MPTVKGKSLLILKFSITILWKERHVAINWVSMPKFWQPLNSTSSTTGPHMEKECRNYRDSSSKACEVLLSLYLKKWLRINASVQLGNIADITAINSDTVKDSLHTKVLWVTRTHLPGFPAWLNKGRENNVNAIKRRLIEIFSLMKTLINT